jgi:hypothetical protein
VACCLRSRSHSSGAGAGMLHMMLEREPTFYMGMGFEGALLAILLNDDWLDGRRRACRRLPLAWLWHVISLRARLPHSRSLLALPLHARASITISAQLETDDPCGAF